MSATRQGMNSAEIDQIIAQQVADAIEAIVVYEIKICMAHDSMNQVVRQGTTVARNVNNNRKWKSDHGRNFGRQQNEKRKVVRAHTTRPGNKKGYAGTLPNCNKCKLHHTGPCPVKCTNCKRVGHVTSNCRSPIAATSQRTLVAIRKATIICYECGKQGHYRDECEKLKNQNYDNHKGNEGKAHKDPNVIKYNVDA
ncbi:reverse transcriptase domain-containing protein [Tanacetum coccineum]